MHGPGSQGLQTVFMAHRNALLRFLIARGAADAAEDILQELWVRVEATAVGPIQNPAAYLYRAAENLMRDRHRAERQAHLREQHWAEVAGPTDQGVSDAPTSERSLIAREELAGIQRLLRSFPSRTQEAFRLHRIEGMAQRDIAARLGVSLSTIEKDLRDIYRELVTVRAQHFRSETGDSVNGGKDGS